MDEARYYSNVKELMETSDIAKANKLLSEGWELLTIKEEGYARAEGGKVVSETRVVYIFGRTQTLGQEDIEARLAQLEWRPSSNGKLEYVRDAPEDLLQRVRGEKGGLRTKDYHYIAHKTESVLFRYKKDEDQTTTN